MTWLRKPTGVWLVVLMLTAIFASHTSLGADTIKRGDVVLQLDLNSPKIQNLKLPKGGVWVKEGPSGQTALKVVVAPEDAADMNVVSVPIDLRPFRGQQLSLYCLAKAEKVSEPTVSWLGVKCMIHYRTPAGDHWHNQNRVIGTFDWKPLNASVPVTEDADTGELLIGLQGCSGTAWIADVKLVAMKVKPDRPPLPPEGAVLPPAYKGHDWPRLRGVMSPNQFSEQDFKDLAKWNVNVIRWQMTRQWGVANTDLDLDEYDRWLNSKLDDAEKALDAAHRYGMKVILDLHTPPGGRLPDGTGRMYIEKKYQDHFVEVWQRIATRFKGNPALWAYDLVNEPAQNQPSPEGVADWLGAQIRAAKAIRKIDATTAISFEVDGMDIPDNFAWMEKVDIPNVIYQVHMYWPGDFTHQRVGNTWNEHGAAKLLPYPGVSGTTIVNKDALRARLQPVRDFQRAYNVHIFVGEFSAIRWAPGADRYIADCIDLFEEYGWDWTYHAFREWPGWSVEHEDLPADPNKNVPATQLTDRAKVLLGWFAKNQKRTAD